MVRPVLLPRHPGVLGSIPPLIRPPIGIRGPLPAVIRPAAIASVTPVEKPQTTVYVGKIASTVENDFILAVLQLCGPVKSWKRAQDPTNGAPKGFGFCEFESAEGVLRALRLLSKLNIDGQELMINVNQATKEYLERYAENKAESSKKLKEAENVGAEKEEGKPAAEKNESPKLSDEESKKEDNDAGTEKKLDSPSFETVSDEDREADQAVLEKLTFMVEERLKNNPLPPPPPLPAADVSNVLNSEQPTESKDGDSNMDDIQNGEDKRDEHITGEAKLSSEQERLDTSSPDRSRRNDRRSRDRDRDKRDKERELERYEREREQERSRREREREYKSKEDDRRYKARVKDWESRERDKEYIRKQEKDKEKEREYMRKQDVLDQELEDYDGDSKKRKHKSNRSEERRRRIREKEEDLADRLEEEEELAEAKKRAEEELRQLKERVEDAAEPLPGSETNRIKGETRDEAVQMTDDGDSGNVYHIGDGILQNGDGDDSVMGNISASDMQQNNSLSSKKLGFGLVGSGKRTTVLSVFSQEEDEDVHKGKKMRPLVPIDYSTEELQAVQSSTPVAPSSNLAAAAEFAKQISGATTKEDRADVERERSKRSHDRSSHRDRNGAESNRSRDENRKDEWERDREQRQDRKKMPDNQKLLDAKQLIDMIPKTKDELFSYQINWSVYDKNELHDRMKPWISKKITEFLGEEETTLVDYIVSSTQEHVDAAEMLDRLQSILDDEAEMFVLKMWRMLIFEIKKIETGLAQRAKS